MSESDYKSSKQKVPELPSELRRAAKISTSGYWAGVLLEAADEIEAARRQDETTAVEPSFAGLKLVTVVDGSVPPDTIEFRASDGRVLGRIRQLAIASVNGSEQHSGEPK